MPTAWSGQLKLCRPRSPAILWTYSLAPAECSCSSCWASPAASKCPIACDSLPCDVTLPVPAVLRVPSLSHSVLRWNYRAGASVAAGARAPRAMPSSSVTRSWLPTPVFSPQHPAAACSVSWGAFCLRWATIQIWLTHCDLKRNSDPGLPVRTRSTAGFKTTARRPTRGGAA